MNLSEQIKKFRKEKNMKQEELAKKLGKSKSVISNWEKGINKPDADTIAELCKILKITPNQLFNWKENDNELINIYFKKLNEIGKRKALERIEEMVELPKYQEKENNEITEKIKNGLKGTSKMDIQDIDKIEENKQLNKDVL